MHAADTSILLSNKKASEILGLTQSQIKGKKAIDPMWRFVKEDRSDMPLKDYPVKKVFKIKKILRNYIVGVKRSDRNYITWVNINATPVFDENNKIKYASITFIDITNEKRAENKLKIKDHIFNYSAAANSISDTKGIITEANDSFLKVWGFSNKKEVIGKSISYFFKNKKEALTVLNALNTKGNWIGHFTAKRKDGSTFIAYGPASILYSPDKKIMGYSSSVYDITEEKKTENKIKKANIKLIKANDLKSVILKDITHKLRNPAVISVMASENLKKEFSYNNKDKTKINKYLKIINENAKQFDKDIKSLLKLGEIENIEKIIRKNVNLRKLVEEVLTENHDLIEEKGIDLKFCKDTSYAICNKNLIKSLFYNLIHNSLMYSKNGYIKLDCKKDKKNKKIYITIEDNGIGIKKKDLKKIFEPFSNPDPSSKGLGIGLSICKKIIDLHEGSIGIESKYKKGTKITFSLPLGRDYNEKKILVVEDDEDINFIYQDILEKDYNVAYAKTAEEARVKLKDDTFDLIILDVILPGKTGDMFFKELKKSPKYTKMKIIIVSILSDTMGQLDRIDQDITCIQKPFDEIKLLNAIKEKFKE